MQLCYQAFWQVTAPKGTYINRDLNTYSGTVKNGRDMENKIRSKIMKLFAQYNELFSWKFQL